MTTLRKQLILAALGVPTQQSEVEVDVDLNLSGQNLLFANVLLRQQGFNALRIRNLADTADYDLWVRNFVAAGIATMTVIQPPSAASDIRINEGGGVEVARIDSSDDDLDISRAGDITGLAGKTLAMDFINGFLIGCGERVQFDILSAAPAIPVVGDLCCADRVNWDPLGRGGVANPYLVFYDGVAWKAVSAP